MPDLPKLSYVLLSHNRKDFIRSAVESAFAQEYDGELEYIFSDDCSMDGTFDILRECAASYKGKRRVVVTQTPSNGRTAANYNNAFSYVRHDWIVRADDDDLSYPDRCQLVGDSILRFPQAVCLLEPCRMVSDADCVLENVKKTEEARTPLNGTVFDWKYMKERGIANPMFGHARVFARRVYSSMGYLPPETFQVDDLVLALRAIACGSIVRLEGTPTILYRRGEGSQSCTVDGDASVEAINLKENKLLAIHERSVHGLRHALPQFAQSLASPDHMGAQEEALEFLVSRAIPQLIHEHEEKSNWWNLSTWRRLVNWSRERNSVSKYTFGLARTFPRPLAIRCYSALKRLLK